jgi:integrase
MSSGRAGSAARARRSSSASGVTARFARMIERAAAGAGVELKAHMLRHACGRALANKGHDTRAIQGWFGHRSITSTASTRPWRRTGSRTPGRIRLGAANHRRFQISGAIPGGEGDGM